MRRFNQTEQLRKLSLSLIKAKKVYDDKIDLKSNKLNSVSELTEESPLKHKLKNNF